MDNSDLKCCLCSQSFNAMSQPRMMPYCQHSGCTSCIKKAINNKTATFLKCQHCGQEQNVDEIDLQYFPKNISLTKMIKEMSQSSQSRFQQTSLKDFENTITQRPKVQLCRIHNKEIQIICITDKEKLCPHCALFGKHKDHNFKTLTEAVFEMQEVKRYFEGCRKKKKAIDQKINSKQFKQTLINKIGNEKDRLVNEIKNKFVNLYENIRLAEKQAFEDVVKHFKTIYQKIVALVKQENDSNLKYRQWEQRCAQLFVQASKLKSIQEKSFIYFGGPLEICKEGDIHLKKIQNKLDINMLTIEKLISSIKVVDNVAAANSLFNYINIAVDSQDIQMVTQAAHEIIQFKEIKQEIIEPRMRISSPQPFSSLSKVTSNRHITPKKRSSSKQKNLNCTSERRYQAKSPVQNEKATIEKMVQQFCERQNLDTLDLTGYNLTDSQILDVLRYLKPIKKIKGLKLVKNKLSNDGLSKIIEMIPTVTNLNVSFNQLGDEALGCILAGKQRIPMLRIINISNNKINQRKARTTVEQLKRQGIIVTI